MIEAWHFIGNTLRDGRPVPADGETLRHDGPLVLCESGLHASIRAIDALDYAPGTIACRVQCDGEIHESYDKLVCRERTILWRVDAAHALRAFARWCALQVAHLWDSDDALAFLQTGDVELMRAALDAAEEVVESAAGATVWAIEWVAVEAAARAAARAAAGDAAGDAAGNAARAAAWTSEREAQNTQLETMLHEARDGRTEWAFDLPQRSSGPVQRG